MSNPASHPSIAPAIETLPQEVCWAHLSASTIGRLAVLSADGIDIFPINFLTHGGVLYFRSAPGHKMMDVTREPRVAFETDGTEGLHRWSVVVRGVAERLTADEEIVTSGVLDLKTVSPTEKWNFVRITPSSVSGRRFSTPGLRYAPVA